MRLVRSLLICSMTLATPALWAADTPKPNDAAAYAQMKSLAGEWESKTAKGGTAHLKYEVVSGGSAVVEHFESDDLGSANAMVTVYYMDGDHLQLTHYCMAGNQPHMQASAFDGASGELHFAFVNASGLSGPEAGHMHNAAFRFIDANHFATDWQFYEGGKPKFNEAVEYTRVR